MPIYNSLIGLSGLSSSASNTNYYGYNLDLNGTILSLSTIPATTVYDSLSINYLTVGMQTNTICAKCGNNFISQNQCVDVCPILTYQFTFPDGGKACLECSLLAGLKINDLANGCNCLPGYEVLTQHQCVRIKNSTTCTGTNVVQNGTQCICSPGTFNISGSCQVCTSGTFFDGTQCQQQQVACNEINTVINPTGNACICIAGFTNYSGLCRPTCRANSGWEPAALSCVCTPPFMDIQGQCMPCLSDQSFDPALKTCRCTGMNQELDPLTGACRCSPGFFNISNFCIICPVGTIPLNGQCTPSSCQDNQILSNGVCICDHYSYKQGSVCVPCGLSTFPNNITKSC